MRIERLDAAAPYLRIEVGDFAPNGFTDDGREFVAGSDPEMEEGAGLRTQVRATRELLSAQPSPLPEGGVLWNDHWMIQRGRVDIRREP